MLFTRQINQFMAVAKAGSFIRAAEDISLTPSALSHGVRELEERVGKKLIVRTKSGTSLTKSGRFFYDELTPLYEKGQDVLKRTLNENKKITIWIDDFYHFLCPTKIQKIIESCGVDVEVFNGCSGLHFENILNGSCDIFLSVFNEFSEPLIGEVSRVALPIENIEILASRNIVDKYNNIEDVLKNEVIFQRSSIIRHPVFNKLQEQLLQNSFNCNFVGLPDFADVCGAVSMGLGVSLVSSKTLSYPMLSEMDLQFVSGSFPINYKINRGIYFKASQFDRLIDVISCLKV